MNRSSIAVIGFLVAVAFGAGGCGVGSTGSAAQEHPSAAQATTSGATSSDGGSTPPLDNGALGPGSSPSGSGRHQVGSGASHSRADAAVVIIGGPTVSNDYPELWGNLYADVRSQCAVFNSTVVTYAVRLDSVAVTGPFVVVHACTPLNPYAKSKQPCRPGLVLAAGGHAGCVLGMALGPAAQLSHNYTGANRWTFSTSCRDTQSEPCSAAAVAAHHPSPSAPVTVRWTVSRPVRFCGATDYADEHGDPGGKGSNPGNGCSSVVTGSSQGADSTGTSDVPAGSAGGTDPGSTTGSGGSGETSDGTPTP